MVCQFRAFPTFMLDRLACVFCDERLMTCTPTVSLAG